MRVSQITGNDKYLIAALAIMIFGIASLVSFISGVHGIILSVSLGFAILLVYLVDIYRRINREISQGLELIQNEMLVQTHQVESLLSIHSLVKPTLPLPRTMEWAASPDFICLVINSVIQRKPDLILEAGSGVSTLITAYILRDIGKGMVVSLDHDSVYAAKTEKLIDQHGLQDYARVIHAPLSDVEISGETWKWYSLENLNIDQDIDMLVIDGPPRSIRSMARYPALPLLHERLAKKFRIFLDDAGRKDEKKVAERWEHEYPQFNFEFISLQKGALVIRDKIS